MNGGLNVTNIRLKYWRKRRVLTIAELAAKADVTPQTIVTIEKGRNPNARPETLRKLAGALSIGIEELVVDDTPSLVA